MNTKYIFLPVFVLVLLMACNRPAEQIPGEVVEMPNTASGEAGMDRLPALTFRDTVHDFGRVIQGEVVSYAFKFTNTGKSDLVIAGVSASCGCTATDYPKKPVKPGEQDFIKVTFSSGGRQGYQKKTVAIAANTQPNTTVIAIIAEVITPERN